MVKRFLVAFNQKFKSVHFEFGLDWSFDGSIRRCAFELAQGYNISLRNERLYLRPIVALTYGPSEIYLGPTNTTSEYLSVNNIQFYKANKVSLHLSS